MKVSVQDNNKWVELTKKIAIEDAIYRKNKKKFAQTNSTPTMIELLVSDLAFLGNSNICNQILSGMCIHLASTNKYSKAFIKALAKPTELLNLPKVVISTKVLD